MATRKAEPAMPRIFTVRRQKVVLAADLAKLYGVPTKRLNEAVRRNAERFPADFCFVLTEEEDANLRSQFATSSSERGEVLRSQFATSSLGGKRALRSQNVTSREEQHGGRRYLPRVFTEHGALMAANVLRSKKAVQMSLYLVRAFVSMREQLASNLSVLRRLAEIDKKLIEHDVVLREVLERLQPLLDAPDEDDAAKPKIGFHKGNR
ncbi:MAG: ORF6N domain-containing protein [Opitutaceae bacterium]